MNEQPLYELQIASKLEQLPVPDMADAIWTRIKDQLDTDMPTGGQNPLPPPTRPRTSGRGKMGLLGVLITSIALIYFISPEKQKQILPSLPQQTQINTTPDTNASNSDLPVPPAPLKRAAPPLKMPQQKNDSVLPASQQISFPPARQDSTAPAMPPVPAKNVVVPVLTPPPVVSQAKDSLPVKKKPRGVKGINDGDYKIVPKTQP